jgi:hypothetical protein
MTGFISGVDASGNFVNAAADGKIAALSLNGTRATFRYVASDVAPVATATDILVIKGSASKVIRLTKVSVVGKATSAAVYDFYLIKRTAANTGGTSTNPTAVKADSNDSSASATLVLYSANPSALGSGQTFEANKLYLAAGSTPNATTLPRDYTFGNRGDKAPVLRGTAESIAFNFNGQAVPAGTELYLSVEWTEDDV